MIRSSHLFGLVPLLMFAVPGCGGSASDDAGSGGNQAQSGAPAVSTGGQGLGGTGSGGVYTGGVFTGGIATGGVSTGGVATGGVSTGGTPNNVAPAGSPVALHGQLHVSGTQLTGEHGQAVQLKGPSSMWLNWESDGYAGSKASLQWMRDNWKLQVIRAAVGVEPTGAFLSNPDKAYASVQKIIDTALELGVYVIVDWHDHNAQNHLSQAQGFFQTLAKKYGGYPNVLWETYNEPLKVDWSTVLKPYHSAVVATIRAQDPDNVIILGTSNWSQDVDKAAADPLGGSNLMYTLHFYSCSHQQWLRDRGSAALAKGLPLFVTEWGATNSDGGIDGQLCLTDAQLWHDWMKSKGISWTAWKLDGCTDSSCILKQGAPADGPFADNWLNGHGPFVRDRMKD